MTYQQQLEQLGIALDTDLARLRDADAENLRLIEGLRKQIQELRAEVEALKPTYPDPDPVDPPPTDGPSTNVKLIQEFSRARDPGLVKSFNTKFNDGGWHQDLVRYAYDNFSTLRIRQWAPTLHEDGRLSWMFAATRPGADHGQVILQHMDRGNPDRLPEGFLLRPDVTYQMTWSVRWDGSAWPASWVQLMQCYGMHGKPNQADGRKDQIGVFVKEGKVELVTHDKAGVATRTTIPFSLVTNEWYRFAIEFRAGGDHDFARLWVLLFGEWHEIDHHVGPIGTGEMTFPPDGYLEPRVGFYGSSGVKVQGSVKDISLSQVVT